MFNHLARLCCLKPSPDQGNALIAGLNHIILHKPPLPRNNHQSSMQKIRAILLSYLPEQKTPSQSK